MPNEDTSEPTTIKFELGDGLTGTGEVLADGAECTAGPELACTIQPVTAGQRPTVLLGVDVFASPDTVAPVTVVRAGGEDDPVVADVPVAEAGLTTSRASFDGLRAGIASSADPNLDAAGAIRSAELVITSPIDVNASPRDVQYALLLEPGGMLHWLASSSSVAVDALDGQRYSMATFDAAGLVGHYGSGVWHAWTSSLNASWTLHTVTEDEDAGGLIELAGPVTVDPGAEFRVPLAGLPDGATAQAYAVGAGGWTALEASVRDGELVISGGPGGAIVERVVVGW